MKDEKTDLQTELSGLLGDLVNGTLSDDELRRLEGQLIARPEARVAYRRYMNLHAAMRRLATTSRAVSLRRDLRSLFLSDDAARSDSQEGIQLTDPSTDGPLSLDDTMVLPALRDELEHEQYELLEMPHQSAHRPGAASRHGWSFAARAAIIALPLMLGIGLVWMLAGRRSPPAILGACINATWEAPYQNLSSGQAMPEESVHLLSGLAEVHYKNGVSVVLQGPARFQGQGATTAELFEGKLTALVPKGADGFTVQTSVARIIDLGTEFGVAVDADGQTHAEVFQGHIRAELSGAAGDASVSQILGVNEAVNISRSANSIQPDVPIPLTFVRVDELQRRSKAGDSVAERWRGRSEALRLDPATVAYYAFDNANDSPDRLVNEASSTAGRFDGLLGDAASGHNPTWDEGRWAGKGALKFEADRRTCVTLPKIPEFLNAPSISVAMWILPTDPGRTMHLLDENRHMQQRFDLVWIGADDPSFPNYDLYFNRGGGEVHVPDILPIEKRWTFVVLTEDPSGNITMYLDGQQAARMHGPPRSGPVAELLIGRPTFNDQTIQNQLFDGLMDELAFMRRVLPAEEVRALYDAGKPENPAGPQ